MTPEQHRETEPTLDSLAEQLGRWIDSESSEEARRLLAQLSDQLGGLSISLELNVNVFDPDRESALPLLQTGLTTSDGRPPYQFFGDSTPMRYLANGEIVVVPHDRCPCCWGCWDFKYDHPTCPKCAAALGQEVKLLIDSNVCPSCELGVVTPTQTKCSECGFEINPRYVAWG